MRGGPGVPGDWLGGEGRRGEFWREEGLIDIVLDHRLAIIISQCPV